MEYEQGIEKEKSAFENFAVKYTIEGDPDLIPVEYFDKIYETLKNFLHTIEILNLVWFWFV